MKYAAVTGSTAGIGYAIAKRLIDEGYFVFLNGRSYHDLDFPKERHRLIVADMSCENGVHAYVTEILKVTNSLDCLVLNAGATCRTLFSEMEYCEWMKVMDTNLNMPFLLVQELHKHIAEDANIVFISSVLGLKPHSVSLAYGVTKAAVNAMAQGLVKEFLSRRVRVNSICPGFVATEWQKEKPDWLREKIEKKIALKRFAEPYEIADVCMSIIHNTYINGAVLSVDGGYDME